MEIYQGRWLGRWLRVGSLGNGRGKVVGAEYSRVTRWRASFEPGWLDRSGGEFLFVGGSEEMVASWAGVTRPALSVLTRATRPCPRLAYQCETKRFFQSSAPQD